MTQIPKPGKTRGRKAKNNPVPTDNALCAMCGQYSICDTHEIYGGINRQISIKNKYQVKICRKCHIQVTNNDASTLRRQALWKRFAQKDQEREWVRNGMTPEEARAEWMKVIGRNYL